MVGGKPYQKFWAKLTPFLRKRRLSVDFKLLAPQPQHQEVHLIEHPLRAFQWAYRA